MIKFNSYVYKCCLSSYIIITSSNVFAKPLEIVVVCLLCSISKYNSYYFSAIQCKWMRMYIISDSAQIFHPWLRVYVSMNIE